MQPTLHTSTAGPYDSAPSSSSGGLQQQQQQQPSQRDMTSSNLYMFMFGAKAVCWMWRCTTMNNFPSLLTTDQQLGVLLPAVP
jgi:hypothetical protein